MLVLSRKEGQTITIGENADIKIVLLEMNGHCAKIGITAPKSVPVHREEIYERIQAEKTHEDLESTEIQDAQKE
jgi:carbon storage regulator